MSAQYFYGTASKRARKRWDSPVPRDPRGTPAIGRIAKILVGQGHGFIRVRGDRNVFFHRGDLHEGTSFNELVVGDTVAFELLEDSISGARALRVQRRHRR